MIDIRNNYGPLNQAIYENAEFAELLVKAESDEGGLTAVEQVRLGAWITQLANQWQAMETAHENGMIPRETFDLIFDDQRRFVVSYPGLRPLMRNLIDLYPSLSDSASVASLVKLLQNYPD